MKVRADIDVSTLPDTALGSKAPIWWGQASMIAIESTIFAILLTSYFYVRAEFPVWPPSDIPRQDLLLPAIGLAILLLSCLPMYLAGEAAKKGQRGKVIIGMALNILMALAFLGIRWIQLVRFPFKWTTDIYGSFVWIIVGLHTMHCIADTVQSTVLLVIVLIRRAGDRQIQGLEVDGLYWYFVVAVWIPVWFVVYLYPRLLKG